MQRNKTDIPPSNSLQSSVSTKSHGEDSSCGDSSIDEVQPADSRANHKGRRGGARRKFRGGKGGRGRRRQRGGAAVRQAKTEGVTPAKSRPWWYAYMERSGLTPRGMQPTEKDGYPVILPSSQAVYILPSAVNPHRASTYVRYAADNDTPCDNGDSSPLWQWAPDENDYYLGFDADRALEPDVHEMAGSRTVTFDVDQLIGEDVGPELNISFDFIDAYADDMSVVPPCLTSDSNFGSVELLAL